MPTNFQIATAYADIEQRLELARKYLEQVKDEAVFDTLRNIIEILEILNELNDLD